MIRITKLVRGRGTVSEALKYGSLRGAPSWLLSSTQAGRPLVFWNVTNRCNLSCSHCYINAGSSARGELSLSEAKALVDDLAEMGIPLLMFSGGEPLAREDFWELAAYVKSRGLKTALSSNGTLITRKVAEKIKAVGIEYVGVSLDGASGKTHDAIRGQPGSFDKAVEGLKNCAEVGLKCGVRVTATKDNYFEIPRLLDLSIKLNVPRFCLYWLVPSGRGREVYNEKTLKKGEVVQILSLLYAKAKELDPRNVEILTVDAPQDGVYVLNRLAEEGSPEYESALNLLKSMDGPCSAGNKIANIDPNGNVYACQFAQLPELKVGNVKERKFSEIWKDDANPILSKFRNKIGNLKGKCGECAYKRLCGGGCRIRAYFQYGDLWAEDPFCSMNSVLTSSLKPMA